MSAYRFHAVVEPAPTDPTRTPSTSTERVQFGRVVAYRHDNRYVPAVGTVTFHVTESPTASNHPITPVPEYGAQFRSTCTRYNTADSASNRCATHTDGTVDVVVVGGNVLVDVVDVVVVGGSVEVEVDVVDVVVVLDGGEPPSQPMSR